jgi:hypothetical protein
MTGSPPFPDPLPPGYRLHDRYLIEAELSPQTMGRAYRASDTQLQELVALNVLDAALRDDEGVMRFRMCFRAAFFRHRGDVYEYGEYLGVPYAVVKYAGGVAVVDVGQFKGL